MALTAQDKAQDKATQAIIQERVRQRDEKGYLPEHDAAHTDAEWLAILQHEIDCAALFCEPRGRAGVEKVRHALFQHALEKVGAVALAAIEARLAQEGGG